MYDQLECVTANQTESSVEVLLVRKSTFPSPTYSDSPIQSISGNITGPNCQFSRTLPAEYSFNEIPLEKVLPLNQAVVIDPCYWTPALPFLYDLKLAVQLNDHSEIQLATQLGLKRWNCQENSFFLDGRRTVLRGSVSTEYSVEILEQAREAGISLFIDLYDPAFVAAANRLGVPLVFDMRIVDGSAATPILRRLDWAPSMSLVIADIDKISQYGRHWPRRCHLAQRLSATSTQADLSTFTQTPALAVEINPGERPPDWMADIDRPVIVIRRSEDYADFAAARQACDRLQAELAPEFDLAGYFVTP